MKGIFLSVLEMSLWASVAAVIVIIARLCLKRVPKIFSYILWSVVLFRLLCPFGIKIPIWITPDEPYIVEATVPVGPPIGDEDSEVVFDSTTNTFVVESELPKAEKNISIMSVLVIIWVLGTLCIAAYGVYSYARLRTRLKNAVMTGQNIYESGRIKTAFVLGFIRPKIYIPSGLGDTQRRMIVMHEHTHLRRFDHIVKLIAYCVLAIHWFNPLMWLCFDLMCKDMELSCDEAVIGGLERDSVAEYCNTLLILNEKASHIAPAFSENDTKKRINNIVSYKKPARRILLIISVVCAVIFCIGAVNIEIKEKGIDLEEVLSQYDSSAFINNSVEDKYAELVSVDSPLYIEILTDKQTTEQYASVKYCYREYEGAITIPESYSGVAVTRIDFDAFMNCRGITEINLPPTLNEIWDSSFYGCTSLRSIDIPDSVVYIGKLSFQNCSSLQSVILPENLRDIFMFTFAGCASLKEIEIPNGVEVISNSVFMDCTSLEHVGLGSKVTMVGSYSFKNCISLKEIYLPSTVAYVAGEAFSGCKNLTAVHGIENVSIIEDKAFEGCDKLEPYYKTEKRAHSYLFAYHATDLTVLEIPEGYTSAAEFGQCTNLISVTLPSTMEYIYYGAFDTCYNLEHIYIPASVKYIDKEAFPYVVTYPNEGDSPIYSKLTIYAPKDSYAAKWAMEMGYKYEEWNG